jgi:hypothetical protein
MTSTAPVLLIIDYNLSRVSDVRRLRDHARQRWNASTYLIRHTPQPLDFTLADRVFDADPLDPEFVTHALQSMGTCAGHVTAGLVFSDNAVSSGAALLEHLGCQVDDARSAMGAFNKYTYRVSETLNRTRLESLGIRVPDFVAVRGLDDLQAFSARHPEGFVVKPMCEGNNRGVVLQAGGGDPRAAFDEVHPYLSAGVIAEQIIPYRREFSYDGLAHLAFITEKVSAGGRYPVELAQVLPAQLAPLERETLMRAGQQVNHLIGQRDGPFHNEIKLSKDGTRAGVVEPNRRPGGMKIWDLARWVYGVDLYEAWVDSVFGLPVPERMPAPQCSAATVMLGVSHDRHFADDCTDNDLPLFEHALTATARAHGLTAQQLIPHAFTWLPVRGRTLHATPRDNSDFAAQVCITLHTPRVDIRQVIGTLQRQWLMVFDRFTELPTPHRVAS